LKNEERPKKEREARKKEMKIGKEIKKEWKYGKKK
jgi:hypothetical protein